jgi:hypothetical protein
MNKIYIVETSDNYTDEINTLGIYGNPILATEKAKDNKTYSDQETWVSEYILSDSGEYKFSYEL